MMPQQGRRSNVRILFLVIAWFLFLYGSSHLFGARRSIRIRKDPNALVFISIGDFGTGSEVQRDVASQLARSVVDHKVSFIVGLGDNIYDDGIRDVDDPQLETKHNQMYSHPALRSIPWYMALGDHDACGNVTAQIEYSKHAPWWHMPEQFYEVVHRLPGGASLQIVVTDSIPLEAVAAEGVHKRRFADNYTDETSGIEKGNQELMWLRERLKDSTADWLLVTGHRPVYSGALRHKYPAEAHFQKMMRKILADHQVDMYMNGHDHTAQHILGDGGVQYLVNGLGGYDFHPVEDILGHTLYKGTGFNGFALHQVTAEAMTVTWIDHTGRPRHQFIARPQRRANSNLAELERRVIAEHAAKKRMKREQAAAGKSNAPHNHRHQQQHEGDDDEVEQQHHSNRGLRSLEDTLDPSEEQVLKWDL